MTQDTMTAVCQVAALRFETLQVPRPQPGPRDALVQVKACGVCGSDIHFYEHGRIGDFVVREPHVLGHEAAGEVVQVGAEVTTLAVGDRVAMEPGLPCRHCAYCLGGRYHLCRDMIFLSAPPHDGFFREFVALPEDFCYRLPDSVSYEAGATVEPLAVGLHAIARVGIHPGENVVVLGAGPIGLLATAAARAVGAGQITAVDLAPMRLDSALQMGANAVVNAAETDPGEALRETADVVLDCAAVDATLRQAFDIIKPGGRVAWVGMAAEEARVPFQLLQTKEATVMGVFRYAGTFGPAVSLIGTGQVDPLPLVTHRFDFPAVAEAVKFAAENRDIALKTLVVFG